MFLRSDIRRAHVCAHARTVATAILVLALGGCEDYLDRRDTVTLGVGDSVAVNRATQTINRWPETARRDRWNSDGERARSAVSRYRSRTVTEPATLDKGTTEDGNSLLDKLQSSQATK